MSGSYIWLSHTTTQDLSCEIYADNIFLCAALFTCVLLLDASFSVSVSACHDRWLCALLAFICVVVATAHKVQSTAALLHTSAPVSWPLVFSRLQRRILIPTSISQLPSNLSSPTGSCNLVLVSAASTTTACIYAASLLHTMPSCLPLFAPTRALCLASTLRSHPSLAGDFLAASPGEWLVQGWEGRAGPGQRRRGSQWYETDNYFFRQRSSARGEEAGLRGQRRTAMELLAIPCARTTKRFLLPPCRSPFSLSPLCTHFPSTLCSDSKIMLPLPLLEHVSLLWVTYKAIATIT